MTHAGRGDEAGGNDGGDGGGAAQAGGDGRAGARGRLEGHALESLGARPLGPQDPVSVGRYRIRALLGIGGMGRVYLGWAPDGRERHAPGGSWAAVKVIRPDLADDPEFRRRFARELEAVGRVSTPFAAALVAGEPGSQQPWMATEFVPGVSLADAVLPEQTLPSASVWRLAHDLGSALVAVHRAELVHRDVKPSNVILGTGGAKIIDFGVAYAADLSQLTATGMNIGTPSYMAPEQAKSGGISPASDVFSLGVLLYFAATGRLPFGSGGTAEVLFRVVYEEPDVSGLDGVEPGLRDLVLRCMAKNPLQRPNAAGIVVLAERAADAGHWNADADAAWPEALAVRIAERTHAAVRTLPDPEAVPQLEVPDQATGLGTPGPRIPMYDAPPPLPFSPAPPRRKHGMLIASASAVAVVGLAVAATLMWNPSSGGSAGAAGVASIPSDTPAADDGSVTAPVANQPVSSASSGLSASRSTLTAPTGGPSSAGAVATSGAGASGKPGAPSASVSRSTSAAGAPTASAPGTPNKYTATEVCGSGFSVIDHHALSGATVYLLYNGSTGYNCVTTMATSVSGKVTMNATLSVQGGGSASDPGAWTYYAGPVAEHAAASCVEWGGTYKGSSWTSGWSHCG